MMGPTKLSTIRAEARKAFKMSDAALLAWFNRQLQDLGPERKANKTEVETLRLLRDALLREANPPARGRQRRTLTARSKSRKASSPQKQ
jgi:hypothetical protein